MQEINYMEQNYGHLRLVEGLVASLSLRNVSLLYLG
jgi:hypothetical protein